MTVAPFRSGAFSAARTTGTIRSTATFAAHLLVIGCGFYLTQIFALSPVYPLVGLSLLFALSSAATNAPAATRLVLPRWSIAVLLLHFCGYLAFVSSFNSALGYSLNLISLGLAATTFRRLSAERLRQSRLLLISFSIALGATECVVRWLFPFQETPPERLNYIADTGAEFYRYKFNSIMYQDSNFVGMWLLVVFAFALGTRPSRAAALRERLFTSALFVLLLLSLCRAAILAAAVIILLSWLWRQGGLFRRFLGLAGTAALILSVLLVLARVAQDDSFQSKLVIWKHFTEIRWSMLPMESLLLGSGLATSTDTLGGIAAHNYFLQLLLECGVVGLIFTLTMHAFYFRRAPSTRGVLFGYYIAGLSMAPMTAPYLYVVLHLSLELARREAIATNSPVRKVGAFSGGHVGPAACRPVGGAAGHLSHGRIATIPDHWMTR